MSGPSHHHVFDVHQGCCIYVGSSFSLIEQSIAHVYHDFSFFLLWVGIWKVSALGLL